MLNNDDTTHCKRSLPGIIQVYKVNLVNCYLNICVYRTCQNPSIVFAAPSLAKTKAKTEILVHSCPPMWLALLGAKSMVSTNFLLLSRGLFYILFFFFSEMAGLKHVYCTHPPSLPLPLHRPNVVFL